MYFMQTVAMEESMMHLSERSLNVIIESHKRYTIDTQSMHKPLKVDSENVTSKPSNTTVKPKKPAAKISNILLKKSYAKEFKYPLYIDLRQLVDGLESGNTTISVEPINSHPYNFIYTPTHSCEYEASTKYPRVVILVKSAASNYKRRELIRNTWAGAGVITKNIRVVFLLGLPIHGNLAVRKESTEHGDIIQEDFKDNYHNNTIKMIMGYKWAVSNCRSTDYLFFVDDDYFVNIKNLVQYVSSRNENEKHKLFSGTLLSHSTPFRVNASKWYVPWEDYPFDKWPPYLAGGAYFVSMALARKFKLAFPYVKPLHIDDTYLGIVVRKLGIRPTSNQKIGYRKMQPDTLQRLIASHGYANKEDVEKAWTFLNQTKQPNTKTIKPPVIKKGK